MKKHLHKILVSLLQMPGQMSGSFRPLLCTVFIIVSVNINPAAAQEMVFSPVDSRQQLNEEKIRNIIELKDGRIGVFTEGMLNIYDGVGFKTIHLDDLNSTPLVAYNGFHHSYIENNHLWFKVLGKLLLINISGERSEKDPRNVLKQMGFTGTPADLFVDTQKDLWVVTDTGKLLVYDRSKKVKLFLNNVAVKANPEDRVYDIAYCNKSLYLFYKSGLIRCFDRVTAKELYQTSTTGNSPDDLQDWIHTTVVNNYIYIIRAGISKGKLLRFDTGTHEIKTLIDANDYWLNTFAATKDGDFIMSSNRGLWQFKSGSTTGTFHPKFKVLGRNDITTEVSSVYFDSQGGLWAGTLNKGLYYYHPERFRFPHYQKQFFHIKEDAELQVNCFEEGDDSKLLVGTSEGLFTMPLPPDGLAPPNILLPNVDCTALKKDAAGTIWIGTRAGLYVMDKDGKITLRHHGATNYIYETKKGQIYACTLNEGLLRWDNASKSFQTVYIGKVLPNITQLTAWNGFLAGLSSKGPFLLDPVSGKITFSKGKGGPMLPMFSQKNYKYTCLFTDSDQDLWVGTYDGLTLWDTHNKKQYRFDTETGLINNSIKAIVQDKDHSIWVTTSRGVSHIVKNRVGAACTFSIINHYKHTGIIEHPFAERSAFLSSGSGLFMGGIDGMNNIPVSTLKQESNYLRPTFLSLKLFGKPVTPGNAYNGNVVLKNSIAATNTLVLDYNQNFFSIAFSGLNYINPSESHFRYKLEGIDDNWRFENPAADYGEANYTGVAPGEYRFILQASSDGIHWPVNPKTMVIVIQPPIWKTTTAKILYGLIICCLIWLTYKSLLKRSTIRREKRHAEAVERAKSDFITNMSHELRTPLTLIITPLRSLIQKVSDPNVKTELQRIGNNANLLLDTVNQLLEFKKIDAATEMLHPHFCGSLSFINELCDAYAATANEKEIIFVKDIFKGDVHIYIDKQKVKRIIVNLLSNAFKFTPTGGKVTLSATFDESTEELIIAVKDTGTGIQQEELNRIFERFYQADNQDENPIGSGIGLFMVKQYVDLHGGTITVESKQGSGTCFTVTLSVKEENTDVQHETDTINPKKTILLVEDHSGFRSYVSSELAPYYNIITAENGKAGLEKALTHLPDLIITDMMMPEMDGAALCKALRNAISVSHTPIIMLTGRASDEARFEGYESGADAYLIKPFDVKFLLLRITKLLELNITRHTTFAKEADVKAESITSNPLDKELLEKAMQYVAKNLSNPDYSVEKFSADMGMDRTGLYRKLIALTGYPPVNFIRSIRLKKAAELLSEGTMTIAEIAEAVGFNSMSYFSKCFNESFNKTPREYREEQTPNK